MKAQHLKQLELAAEALFLAEHRKVRAILEDEARLRRAVRSVSDSLLPDGREGARAEPGPAERSGADVVWRLQARRKLSALNRELAQTLAAKGAEMQRVRQAFGRKEALRLLQGSPARSR